MANKQKQPKVSYEPEADVLSWQISAAPIEYASEMGNVIVHFSKKNVPVYIEVLEASKLLSKVTPRVVKVQRKSVRAVA